jgi:hypothetical protein
MSLNIKVTVPSADVPSATVGSCLCGSVGFEIDGPRTPIELCHRSRCKKAFGSAFAATFYAWASCFRWTRGEEFARLYGAPILKRPPPYRHVFCCRCGSPLPIVMREMDVVEIPAGVIDGDPGSQPLRHIFTSKKAPWFEISDGLPRYSETCRAIGAPDRGAAEVDEE